MRTQEWARVPAAMADTMHHYLQQIAGTMRPGTVKNAELTLREFALLVAAEGTDVTCVAELKRRHVERYRQWLLEWPAARGGPLHRHTVRDRLSKLRGFFPRLDEWDATDRPNRQLVFDSDFPIADEPPARRHGAPVRLLATCKHVGFAAQDRPGGSYSPGPAVQELALATTITVDLRDAARPVLERLAADCGETTNLLLLEGAQVRFAESLEGSHSVRVGSRLGLVLPAHCTSGGKAMLAALPPEELLRRYPTQELEAVGGRPPRLWPALMEDLRHIRERGWAVNLGDSDPSVGGVGVALLSASGYPIAAITAGAPLHRLGTQAQAAELVPALLDARDRIQRRLRGQD